MQQIDGTPEQMERQGGRGNTDTRKPEQCICWQVGVEPTSTLPTPCQKYFCPMVPWTFIVFSAFKICEEQPFNSVVSCSDSVATAACSDNSEALQFVRFIVPTAAELASR